jgi:guanine deaminase
VQWCDDGRRVRSRWEHPAPGPAAAGTPGALGTFGAGRVPSATDRVLASPVVSADLPDRPPFVLRGRILSPLDSGGFRHELDGRIEVDAAGRIVDVGPWGAGGSSGSTPSAASAGSGSSSASTPSTASAGSGSWSASASAGSAVSPPVVDLRPWAILPGLVDLHAHLPQLPNAGLGFGLPLLTWLGRYIFPLERAFDEATAERVAPAAYRAFAASGTTTAMLYGALWEPSTDAAFRAAETHGIRAIIGKVMMDRLTYDPDERTAVEILDLSLRQSADLCSRWHMRDDGRLRYAFTPRFAVSCSPEMLRESARLAAETGAYWQTHLSEDHDEIAEVARLFPDALDYLDVYDRAGALGPRAMLAHAIHLSDREIGRLAESGARVAHCPESNLFLSSGTMPLARYLAAGIAVGLGSDVAAGPDPSIFRQMRVGAYVQNARRVSGLDTEPILGPLDWLRLGTLDGARALGLDDSIGSLEVGKEADLIVVDPSVTDPIGWRAGSAVGGGGSTIGGGSESDGLDDPADLVSRLIFRSHPDMVRGAWVRGRRLEGPASAATT